MALRPLRILCFGDSLTAGYTQDGLQYHPYLHVLRRQLRDAFPGLEVDIEEDGMDGGLTQHFSGRLRTLYRERGTPQDTIFDWVIVLGGTNDLAINARPEAIFENLERTWAFAKMRKTKVLALTVPDLAILTRPGGPVNRVNERRNELNNMILGYTSQNFYAFDFQKTFSYANMPADDRKRFWDDAVHFSPAGYDRMGELVADSLINILKAEEHAAAGPEPTTLSTVRPRKRKMFRDDDVNFDEEKLGPDELRHGYIVVRRADLD